jgi:single-strand DNA-binding protein
MNSFNCAGNLARDAELKTLQSGAQLLEFTIGNNIGYGDKKTTLWIRCTLFGLRGEKLAQYLTKGTKVWVTGELSIRGYTAKDGTPKYSVELNTRDIELIGGGQKQDKTEPPTSGNNAPDYADEYAEFDDDIPF